MGFLVPIGVRVVVVLGVVVAAVVLDKLEAVEVVAVLAVVGFAGVVAIFVGAAGSGFLVPNGVLGFVGVEEREAAFTGGFFAPSATLATFA